MIPATSKRGLLLSRFLQERVDSYLRVSNDEAFFLRSALTFGGFLRLGHRVLSSTWYLVGEKVVPQPGIGPGRPEWALGCKPSLSAISSTGGQKGTFAGALNSLKRNIVIRDLVGLGIVAWPSPTYISSPINNLVDLFLLGQPRKNRVCRRGCVLLAGQIKADAFQFVQHGLGGYAALLHCHHLQARLRNSKGIGEWFFTAQRGKRCDRLAEATDLIRQLVLLKLNLIQPLRSAVKCRPRVLESQFISLEFRFFHGMEIMLCL